MSMFCLTYINFCSFSSYCHGFPAISLDRRVNDNRAIAAMIGLGGFIVILSLLL